MMRCSKCGGSVENPTKFCPECGAKFVARAEPVLVGEEEGLYYCARHKREQTRVTCGRCEKPICPKCMVVGPAGVRCKECAKNRIPLRARGMLHDVSHGMTSGPTAQRVWYLVAIAFVVSIFSSLFGGFNRRG